MSTSYDSVLNRYGSGKCSWGELNNVIKYDSKANGIIPTWRKAGQPDIVTSQDKCQSYLDGPAHIFES